MDRRVGRPAGRSPMAFDQTTDHERQYERREKRHSAILLYGGGLGAGGGVGCVGPGLGVGGGIGAGDGGFGWGFGNVGPGLGLGGSRAFTGITRPMARVAPKTPASNATEPITVFLFT